MIIEGLWIVWSMFCLVFFLFNCDRFADWFERWFTERERMKRLMKSPGYAAQVSIWAYRRRMDEVKRVTSKEELAERLAEVSKGFSEETVAQAYMQLCEELEGELARSKAENRRLKRMEVESRFLDSVFHTKQVLRYKWHEASEVIKDVLALVWYNMPRIETEPEHGTIQRSQRRR